VNGWRLPCPRWLASVAVLADVGEPHLRWCTGRSEAMGAAVLAVKIRCNAVRGSGDGGGR